MTPTQVWQTIARAPQQYVLVGESHHGDLSLLSEFVRGASQLMQTGSVRHIGLELDAQRHQPALDRFVQASAWQRASGWRLARFAASPVLQANRFATSPLQAARWLFYQQSILRQAECYGAQVHCLNTIESRYHEAHNHYCWRDDWKNIEVALRPAGYLTPSLRSAFMALVWLPHMASWSGGKGMNIAQAMSLNRALDAERAKKLRQVAGSQRAMTLFGSLHYRGPGQGGIDDTLPADKTILVQLMHRHHESIPRDIPGWESRAEPDFFIWPGQRALASARAVRRGLV